jgi:hypothetical protein
LAGKHLILIGRDCPALRHVANSAESNPFASLETLSHPLDSRKPWETDIHKQILKGVLFEPSKYRAKIPKLYQAVERAFGIGLSLFQEEDGDVIYAPDFLQLVRESSLSENDWLWNDWSGRRSWNKAGRSQFVTDFFRVSRFLGGCDSQGGRLASMASPEASFDTPNQDCCHFKACLHSVEEIAELMATQEDRTQCQVETKRMAESPTADTL